MTMSLPKSLRPASLHLGFMLSGLCIAAMAQSTAPAPVYRWTTLAGRASVGSADGSVAGLTRLGSGVSLAPVVAGSMLYVLDDGGRISAFR